MRNVVGCKIIFLGLEEVVFHNLRSNYLLANFKKGFLEK